MKLFFQIGLVVCLALVLPGAEPSTSPNIGFILADDLRGDALGCAGNKIVQTPHLDTLAKRGTLFRPCGVKTGSTSIIFLTAEKFPKAKACGPNAGNTFATPARIRPWRNSTI